jgi:hypothetical protein
MKKVTLALVLALALVFGTLGSAGAITNGEPDNGRHPYVGLAVFDVGGAPSHRCSASLLTPTVVLTAGHCTDGTSVARVWFDENVQSNTEYPRSGATSYDGVAHTYPTFCTGCGKGLPGFATGDVGIIILSEPVPTSVVSEYAKLPDEGLVDTLKNKTPVDFVGYGVQEQRRGGGPPSWTGLRVRLFAPSELVSGNFVHSDEFLKLALNPGGGSGGTCFGDSGGPNFIGDSNVVAGVTSFGINGNCAGTGGVYRVDRADDLDWLYSEFGGHLP